MNENQVASLLRNTISGQLPGQTDDDTDLRLSIAGAQEKSALLWHKGQWHKPVGATPKTHILKMPMGIGRCHAGGYAHIGGERMAVLQIVRGFDVPIANCEISQFEDIKVLVVERFDRRLSEDGTWVVRLPQEDFCQATGTSPLHKYQADRGPGISTIMDILLGSEQAGIDRIIFFKT